MTTVQVVGCQHATLVERIDKEARQRGGGRHQEVCRKADAVHLQPDGLCHRHRHQAEGDGNSFLLLSTESSSELSGCP